MDLLFLRHGLAGEHGDPRYPDDSLRLLTGEGRKKLAEAAKAMQKLKLELDLIITSPYKRASQTAEIVASTYRKAKFKISDELIPSGKPRQLIRQLQELSDDSSVMLVGHEPYLSELISVLISGDADSCLKMKKGGLCKLEVGDIKYGQCATLEWLLTPAQMETISD